MADSRIPRVALTTKYDWPEWYNTLRMAAEERHIWKYVNPESPDSTFLTEPPSKPSYVAPSGTDATSATALDAADRAFTRDLKIYSVDLTEWNALQHHYLAVSDWVKNTVKKEYLWAAHSRLDEQTKPKSLQNILREVKAQYEPSVTSVKLAVRDRYLAALVSAKKGGVAPEAWH